MTGVAVNGSCHGLLVNGLVLDSADVAGVVCVRPLLFMVLRSRGGQQGDGRQSSGRIRKTENSEYAVRVRDRIQRTVPSRVAPYPARPKLPIVHMAGQRPRMLLTPGSVTLASI